jgi:hypothetical protein
MGLPQMSRGGGAAYISPQLCPDGRCARASGPEVGRSRRTYMGVAGTLLVNVVGAGAIDLGRER